MSDPIKDDPQADQTASVVNPYDGNIDFAQYSLAQLRELQHTIDSRSYPRNFANLLAELERRQSLEHVGPPAARPIPGRFTRRDDLLGWLTAAYRRLLVYGSGAIEVGAEGVTVNGWQRTWLGVAEQVSLHIPNEQIRNAARDGSKVRFEWKRPYRLARIVELQVDSPEIAEALLSSLPTQQTAGFATRWAELQDFNERVDPISSPAWITLALILINIAVTVAMLIAHPGGFDLLTLQNWGGNLGLLVINGQWWRLVSALFIHASLLHILTNMWVLWNIGRLTERLYGKWPFCVLYFGSGLIGGLASVAWGVNHVSVGASGAIFGLFGAFLVFLMREDTRIPVAIMRAHWLSTTVFVLFNLIAGFLQVVVDNAAHVGGLLGGFALGWLLVRPLEVEAREEFPFKQTVAAAMLVGVCALTMLWQVLGFGSRFSIPEQYFSSRQWYVTGEMQNLKRWQELAERGAAQSISTPEFGREFARDIVPFWQSTAPRLQKEIASLPAAQRPFATLVARFAQQRLDWSRALAAAADEDANKNWITESVKFAQQTQMTMARIERLEVRGSLDHRASGLSAGPLVVSIRNFFIGTHWQCVESPIVGGRHGIARADAPLDGPKARQTAACQGQQLFMSGDYRALDSLINKYRAHLNDLPDGSSSLQGLMGGLGDLIEYGRKDVMDWLSRTADWRRALPGSVNPELVEVMVFREWAWSARGHASAKEVSQQAWAAFAYRSQMAQAGLEDIADRARASPVWYELAVSVGLDTGKSAEDLREIVDRGKEVYPTYDPMDIQMMRVLMPRWLGSYDDENRFVNAMSGRYTASPDLTVYARLYWIYSSLELDQINIFEDGAARWSLMKPGFESMVARYPHSDAVLNGFAKFACLARDREQFIKLRPALTGRLSASVWSDSVSVTSCDAQFAYAPAPRRSNLPGKTLLGDTMKATLSIVAVLIFLGVQPVAVPQSGSADPAPDYSQPGAWAAYAGRPSHADDVPRGVSKGAAERVAVFFTHPTTYLAPVIGNAAFDARGEVGARVDDVVLRFQAAVFNGCCEIFAPRYRQASLKAIITNTDAAYAAADLAYSDVARAFDEFVRVNGTRPFIVASHSQGSIHALRLLQQRIIGTPLQRRLVAAYAIGVALPVQIAESGLPVYDKDDSTGCVLTWNSVRRGHDDHRRKQDSVIWWQGTYQPIAGRPLVCVNPLDWRRDSGEPPTANRGAVYSDGRKEIIPAPVSELTGAWCENGLLGVDVPLDQRRHFSDILTVTGIYHDFDYNLFYMNIRENAARRIAAWKSISRQ